MSVKVSFAQNHSPPQDHKPNSKTVQNITGTNIYSQSPYSLYPYLKASSITTGVSFWNGSSCGVDGWPSWVISGRAGREPPAERLHPVQCRKREQGWREQDWICCEIAAAGEVETGRRAVLGLVAAGFASGSFVEAVLAEAKSIKVGPPPPPSGGLPGTLNSDQPRDLDLPLKNRFFIQPLQPTEAAQRAKESAKDILNVKSLIDKKAWPYVQNNVRLKAEYLRYDLNTVISAKPKDDKKSLKELTGKLFQTISELDHAAKIKSTPEDEKYYAATVTTLNDVLVKLG